MKKFKKTLKAMTLVEIIVALAVFAMLSLILAIMGNAVEKQTQDAHSLNSRVAVEGPIAEAQNVKDSYIANDKFAVKVGAGTETPTGFKYDAKASGNIEGTICYVNDQLGTNPTDASGNLLMDPNVEERDYAFKYVVITRPTTTATTTTTK